MSSGSQKPTMSSERPPELQQPRSAEWVFAETLVRQEGATNNALLVKRFWEVKALVAVTLLTLVSVLWSLAPQVVHGTADFGSLSTIFAMASVAVQVIVLGYFAQARDADYAMSVAQLVMVIGGLQIITGMFVFGVPLFVLASIVAAYLAYRRLRGVRHHWL